MRQEKLEQLAALIDGRLEGDERDEALRRIADDEETYEVFTESVRLADAAAAEPEGSQRTVISGRWMPRQYLRLGAIAAAASVVLAAGLVLWPGAEPSSLDIAEAAGGEGTLPADWTVRRWSVSRGAGTLDGDDSKALRLGVHSSGLVAAIAADDRNTALQELAAIRALLAQVDLAQPAIVEADRLAQELRLGQGSLDATQPFLEQTLPAFVDTDYLAVGRWIEAVRLGLLADVASVRRLAPPATLALQPGLSAAVERLARVIVRSGDGGISRRQLLEAADQLLESL